MLFRSKEIEFANQNLYFDPSRFLLTLSYVPVYARFVNVSSDKPYFALTLKFSLNQVYEVLKELDGMELKTHKTQSGIFLGVLSEELLSSFSKLVELTQKSQKEADFLSPMIVKEILFYLLNDEATCLLD